MLHREWYTLEVSVHAPEWTELPRQPVAPAGREILTVGRKAFRPLERAMDEKLMRPTVEDYPAGSGFVRDMPELNHRIRQCRGFWHELELSKHAWATAEADQARKIVLQRGGAPGWWVQADGLRVEERPSMRAAFKLWGEKLFSVPLEEQDTLTRYKRGTSHGWPDYATSDLSLVLHALWASSAFPAWDRFVEIGTSLAAAMEQADTPLSAILYNRTGPLGKPVYAYDTSGSRCERAARLTGLCCRRRAVYGMPSAGNMLQKRWADALKKQMYKQFHFYHPGGPSGVAHKIQQLERVLPRGGRWVSDDIKSFDTNVRPNHQVEMADEIHARISPAWPAFKRRWKDLPLLAPPIARGGEAFLYNKEGGTPSGSIDTAIDGSLINAARITLAMAVATRRTLNDTWRGLNVWWTFLCLGDDTLLRVPPGWDEAAYVAASESLGYPCSTSHAMVFLMHSYTVDGDWAPLASRVLQQTLFNEYAGSGPATEVLAFAARAHEHFWRRNPWAGSVQRLLRDAEPFKRYGVDPINASDALLKPSFAVDLTQELRDRRARKRIEDLWEESLPSRVSAFIAQHITIGGDDFTLPAQTGPAALADAMRIAAHMALTEDERPDTIQGLSPATLRMTAELSN